MTKKIIMLAIAILVSLSTLVSWGTGTIFAQDTTKLELGKPTSGELTKAQSEQVYTLEATENQLVLINATPELSSDLLIQLVISGPDGTQIADTNELFYTVGASFGDQFVMVVPTDGTYTIKVLGGDDKTVGKYTLEAVEPSLLEADQPVERMVNIENSYTNLAYYQIRTETPITLELSVQKTTEFALHIGEVTKDNFDSTVAFEAKSDKVKEMRVSLEAGVYIVILSSPLFVFDSTELQYTLQYRPVSK